MALPVIVRLAGEKAIVVRGAPGLTFTVAVAFEKPLAVAKMVVLPDVAPGVTDIFALEAPAETLTLAGTLATFGMRLARLTIWPAGPAGDERITIRVPGALVKFSGFGASESPCVAIVTVAGALFWNPSFTINCTT